MSKAGRVDLYAMCLNEARIIPYFMRHYSPLVDRFFILDNGSADGSVKLLLGDPRVSVRPFETEGDSFVDFSRTMLNGVWKASRGLADWVIVVELDEHLHHADLPAYLDHARQEGITAIRTIGYQMTADAFPAGAHAMWREVVQGVRDKTFDKLAIFQPDAVRETNFEAGRHGDDPEGLAVFDPHPQVKLLHYKNLGADYVCERNAALAGGLRERDASERWGAHYLRDRAEVERDLRELVTCSRRVPGLPRRFPLDLTMDDEQQALRESGLFDVAHYLISYPGLATRGGIDPLAHFCTHGWREGRRPNTCFDPAWYLAHHADEVSQDVNPLLDYALEGERAGRAPTAWFDPSLYRHQHGLSLTESPLRHFLEAQAAARRPPAWQPSARYEAVRPGAGPRP